MKSLTLKLVLASSLFALSACSKKEDQPAAGVPHVAGQWAGSGTDTKVGFYNLTATLGQSGNSASGDITMASSNGTIRMNLVPSRANYSGTITIATTFPGENCITTMSQSTNISTAGTVFQYVGHDCTGAIMNGGLNLHMIAAASSAALSFGGIGISIGQ